MEQQAPTLRDRVEQIIPTHYLSTYEQEMNAIREDLSKAPESLVNLSLIIGEMLGMYKMGGLKRKQKGGIVDLSIPLSQSYFDADKSNWYKNITLEEATTIGATYRGRSIAYDNLPLPFRQEKIQDFIEKLSIVQQEYPLLFPSYQKLVDWDPAVEKPRSIKLLKRLSPKLALEELADRNGLSGVHRLKLRVDEILVSDPAKLSSWDIEMLSWDIRRIFDQYSWMNHTDYYNEITDMVYKALKNEIWRQRNPIDLQFARGIKDLFNEQSTGVVEISQNIPLQKAA